MSHNEINPKKGGHFFNGFLWGAIIGGGAAYILSTKKGRDLLKNLTQDGLDMLDDLTTEPEMTEEEMSPITDEIAEKTIKEEKSAESEHIVDEKKPETTIKKRFFRANKK